MNSKKWIKGKELREALEMLPFEFMGEVRRVGLEPHDRNSGPVRTLCAGETGEDGGFAVEGITHHEVDDCFFLRAEADEAFGRLLSPAEPADEPPSAMDRERLKQAVDATAELFSFCLENSKAGKLTKLDEARDLIQRRFKHVPETTIRLIWNGIPAKYRQGPGRPKNG